MSNGVYLAETFQYGPAGRAVVESGSAASILRARILLHLLFSDRLVIPDSQVLNNTYLRSLLWSEESTGAVPADLGQLITEGRLTIARRDTLHSLGAVREDQVAKGMPDIPSPEYAEFVDGLIADRAMEWSFDNVSSRFKQATLRMLRPYDGIHQVDNRALAAAISWVERQDVLYYARFLDWRRTQAGLDDVALDRINKIITLAYGLSVPQALNLESAGTADQHSPMGHIVFDRRPGAEARSTETDCFSINSTILSQLPVELILAAVDGPHRRSLVRSFTLARTGGAADWDTMVEAFHGLMEDLNAATLRYLRHHDMAGALAELEELRPRARLTWLLGPVVESATDIVLDVVGGGSGVVPGAAVRLGLLGVTLPRARRKAIEANRRQLEFDRLKRRWRLVQGRRDDEHLVRPPESGPLMRLPDEGPRVPRQGRYVADPARIEDAEAAAPAS